MDSLVSRINAMNNLNVNRIIPIAQGDFNITNIARNMTCNRNYVQDSRADGGLGQHYKGAE